MIQDAERFRAAISRIDDANRDDPNREMHHGQERPRELLYAERMTDWLERLAPGAAEAVQLAARAQHIRRWEIPRDRYPMDRDGYRRWRTDLGKFHADTTGRILRGVGYEEVTVERVGALLRKERLKTDPDCQLLEDVICLVFLEYELADFAKKHDEEKLIHILRRTWKKMSPRGHQAALAMPLPDALRSMVEKAVAA
jgi:Domain of unknown function (DUF4202)